jgi:hypothetical protein
MKKKTDKKKMTRLNGCEGCLKACKFMGPITYNEGPDELFTCNDYFKIL